MIDIKEKVREGDPTNAFILVRAGHPGRER